MKFLIETKEKGYEIKKKAIDIVETEGWISLGEVIEIVPDAKIIDDYVWHIGWNEDAELKKKVRVRKGATNWWLYFPECNYEEGVDKEDNVTLTDEDIWRIVDQTMRMTIGTHAGLPCKVISKPTKNVIREEEGLSLGVFQLNFTKADDEVVAFPVFIVVMKNGGFVRQVKPENIIFELEGDE